MQINLNALNRKGAKIMEIELINLIKSRVQDLLEPNEMIEFENALSTLLEQGADKLNSNKNLIKKFISAKKIEGCSKRTEEYYYSTLIQFEKTIKCDICFADTTIIREYLINYQKVNNCTNVTLDTVRRILSSFYKWLEEEDYILRSPMKRIHKIKTPKVIKPALSEEEIEAIRETVSDNKRNLVIVDLLLSSGIRVGELVRLNRSSINLNSRSCIVFGKGEKQRITYFDVRTKFELENYLKSRKDKNKALFVSFRKKNKNGIYTRLKINTVEKIIRETGVKADIENVHPHRFRRTLATRAIDKGMPIEQVQVLLGHTKIDTTLHYANVQQTNVRFSYQKFIC